MSGPNSNPAVSALQSYRTPPEFLDAVQRKFDTTIAFDLACTAEDKVAPHGFEHPTHDALASAWPTIDGRFAAWCNPPFAKAGSFARVAAESPHCRTLMLIPASVGTRWWAEHVDGRALVVMLRPRIVFLQPDGTPCVDKEGREVGINRDCALLAYGWTPGYVCADWREW